ncbi:pyridine nucleotide transhydrogenase [Vibrio caribbeanicus]|uniref:pyridine nucleotide transhydrogenase n=1 Tax=Vibrio caribbeanicus TaxID=701175 RepID=UPI002285076C|nr:pyridine nucleotide transhydrogenase [Vibrio caribbeanicus]MCY9844245.1 pyridine nucleotide transhydrogenase [Vibrio caribbeanicus]
MDALIGYTGFVGSSLSQQRYFDKKYNSSNISKIEGMSFNSIYCCGAPGVKWLANKEPKKDLKSIELLCAFLETVDCEKFVLISTVDVFQSPDCVDEDSIPVENKLPPYGKHRLHLERFCQEKFDNCHIVRLPGLVGDNLKKNPVYDLAHRHNLSNLNGSDQLQFYPIANLNSDIDIAITNELPLVHLTSQPITLKDLAKEAFDIDLKPHGLRGVVSYDFRTKFANLYGSTSHYQSSRRETLLAARIYKSRMKNEAVDI